MFALMLYDRIKVITSPELHLQESMLLDIFSKDEALSIFDIGACEGESSIRYSRLFPQARIYTFEPIPSNVELIKKHIHQFEAKQVTVFDLCLSDKAGTAEFHVSSGKPDDFKDKDIDWEFGNKSSSLLPPDKTLDTYKWLEFKDKIEVRTERLDAILEKTGVNSIDFVHMDVQGAELMVLNGSGNRFKDIRNIWLEVEAVPLYKGQPVKKDIEHYFASRGYIKILDTVDRVAGDQFWSHEAWIRGKKGDAWVNQKLNEVKVEEERKKTLYPKKSAFQTIREKLALGQKLRKIIGKQ